MIFLKRTTFHYPFDFEVVKYPDSAVVIPSWYNNRMFEDKADEFDFAKQIMILLGFNPFSVVEYNPHHSCSKFTL